MFARVITAVVALFALFAPALVVGDCVNTFQFAFLTSVENSWTDFIMFDNFSCGYYTLTPDSSTTFKFCLSDTLQTATQTWCWANPGVCNKGFCEFDSDGEGGFSLSCDSCDWGDDGSPSTAKKFTIAAYRNDSKKLDAK